MCCGQPHLTKFLILIDGLNEFTPERQFYMGQSQPLFGLFSPFSHSKYKCSFNLNNINWKSKDGVQTWGRRMMGTDKTTELWRPPNVCEILPDKFVSMESNHSASWNNNTLQNTDTSQSKKLPVVLPPCSHVLWSPTGLTISMGQGSNAVKRSVGHAPNAKKSNCQYCFWNEEW